MRSRHPIFDPTVSMMNDVASIRENKISQKLIVGAFQA